MNDDTTYYVDLITQMLNDKKKVRMLNRDYRDKPYHYFSYDNVMTPILNILHKKFIFTFESEEKWKQQ